MKKITLITAALAITTCMTPALAVASPMHNCIARGNAAIAECIAECGARVAQVRLGFVDQDGDGVCDNYQSGNQQGPHGNGTGVGDGTGHGNGSRVCDGTGRGNGKGNGTGVCDGSGRGAGNGNGSGTRACDGTGRGNGQCRR